MLASCALGLGALSAALPAVAEAVRQRSDTETVVALSALITLFSICGGFIDTGTNIVIVRVHSAAVGA